jgi:hypothetical protein
MEIINTARKEENLRSAGRRRSIKRTLLRQDAWEPFGMSRRNVERMDAQNRSGQNGNNPGLGVPVQVLSDPLGGTGL